VPLWSKTVSLFSLCAVTGLGAANGIDKIKMKKEKRKNVCALEAHSDSSDRPYREERRDETC
jgi:hypothetical protein